MDSPAIKLECEQPNMCESAVQDVHSAKRFPVCVMLENIRSLYNVGSIFRTSDGAMIEKLYLGGYTGLPPRKEIEKTALGSTKSVPWEHCRDVYGKIKYLKNNGYRITILEHMNKSIDYTQVDYDFPLCLVVGNEVEGVSKELISLGDFVIEIPMFGAKQSLNVSVAYGIIIYHLRNLYGKNYESTGRNR